MLRGRRICGKLMVSEGITPPAKNEKNMNETLNRNNRTQNEISFEINSEYLKDNFASMIAELDAAAAADAAKLSSARAQFSADNRAHAVV